MSQPANDEFSQHLSDDEESNHEDASDTNGALPEYFDNEVKWKVIRMETPRREIINWKGCIVRVLLTTHGAEVSTEDANHKFLRSLPPAWSNLAMTMRTNPRLHFTIDEFYNTLEFFEQEIQVSSKKPLPSASNYFARLLPLTNIPEEKKEVLAGFAEEKFYKKTGRRVRVDGKTPVGFDKKKFECFNCHNTDHSARESYSKGTHDERRRETHFITLKRAGKQEKNQMGLLTIDDGIVNWENILKLKRQIMHLEEWSRKEQLQKTLDSWKDSSKNLWRLINSGMSSNSKVGLGFEIQSNNEVLSYEEEMNFSVFNCSKEDSIGKPLYSRFTKTNDFKGVPHPLSGDYTPKPQEEIDDSLYVYGKKGPQKPEISVSDDNSSEHSTCQSNDSEGSCGNTSEHSFETESESLSVPNEMSKSRLEIPNEKVVSELQEVDPSCAKHVKTPRQPLKDKETHKVNRKNWNDMMERELGEGYSFTKKKCFVCGSLNHLIKDCDYYEKKMAREAELEGLLIQQWVAQPYGLSKQD
ncbi:putative ribonuclease H-like domain-containing protein [Tanacetum coccineum]